MKKKIFTLLALFAGVLGASAANEVTVSGGLVAQGKTGDINIELSNPGDAFCAFQVDLKLPEGITFVSATKSARFTAQSLGNAAQGGNIIRFTSVDTENNENYLKESGTLFTVTVKDESGKDVGTKLAAQLLNMEFTRKNESAFKPDALDFNIVISDRIVLDENSATEPEAQTGVNVLVKRTIKAGQWNTICLPFDLPDAKVKEIFGADVKLCDFDGYTVDGTSFTVKFKDVSGDGIYSGWPCLIKTSADISEFEVDGVDVSPVLTNVESKEKRKSGKTEVEVVVAKMTGTMSAGTTLANNELFISGGKFYFSTGSTTIKGFRGYFWLEKFDGASAAPEINFEVGGEATKIDGLNVIFDDGQYYNLKGQKVDNPTEKGVYIKNGKKIVVK